MHTDISHDLTQRVRAAFGHRPATAGGRLACSGDRFAPLDLSPQRKKERTLAALLRQLGGLARTQPVLMIFEDLHWIDPTSRELFDLILARIDRLRVLLVAIFRPEFEPPWVGRGGLEREPLETRCR